MSADSRGRGQRRRRRRGQSTNADPEELGPGGGRGQTASTRPSGRGSGRGRGQTTSTNPSGRGRGLGRGQTTNENPDEHEHGRGRGQTTSMSLSGRGRGQATDVSTDGYGRGHGSGRGTGAISRVPNDTRLVEDNASESPSALQDPFSTLSHRGHIREEVGLGPLRSGIPSDPQPHHSPYAARETTSSVLTELKSRYGYRSSLQRPITATTRIPTCGNKKCRQYGHSIAICPGPATAATGFLDGCPLCNTGNHLFHYCPHIYRLTLDDLYGFLVQNRNNKPPLNSVINPLALIAWKGRSDCVPTRANSWQVAPPPLPWDFDGIRDKQLFPVDELQFADNVIDNWWWLTERVTMTRTALQPDISILEYDTSRGSVMNFVPLDIIPQGDRFVEFIRERGIIWKDEGRLYAERFRHRLQSLMDESATNDSKPDPPHQTAAVTAQEGPLSIEGGLLSFKEPFPPADSDKFPDLADAGERDEPSTIPPPDGVDERRDIPLRRRKSTSD